MTELEFKEMAKRLSEYFGLTKNVSWDRFRMWYLKVKHIPAEAIPHIENCIQDNHSRLPHNLPLHIREYFLAWKSANTEKFISYPRTPCNECGGKGLIWASRAATIDGKIIQGVEGPLMEIVSYRCSQCENWQRHCHSQSKPAATKAQLLDKGYFLQ